MCFITFGFLKRDQVKNAKTKFEDQIYDCLKNVQELRYYDFKNGFHIDGLITLGLD
jgi:hypothetical protein